VCKKLRHLEGSFRIEPLSLRKEVQDVSTLRPWCWPCRRSISKGSPPAGCRRSPRSCAGPSSARFPELVEWLEETREGALGVFELPEGQRRAEAADHQRAGAVFAGDPASQPGGGDLPQPEELSAVGYSVSAGAVGGVAYGPSVLGVDMTVLEEEEAVRIETS
jgi:hypothetical protein